MMRKNNYPSCLPYALIVIVSAVLYAKTLFFGLTFLDDDIWLLSQQSYLRGMTNIFKLFVTIDISGVYYRPMIALSFLIDAKLSSIFPYAYRVTNILLHAINACLVFRLLGDLQFKKKAALIFALIFAVHPALVQTIAWIPGRTNSLLGIFVFAAVINFIAYLNTKDRKNIVWHFVFLLCALLTKETAVIMPVVCLAYWVLITDRAKTAGAMKGAALVWCAAALIWFILRRIALGDSGGVIHAGMINAFWLNFPAVILYFGKVFLPVNLTVLPVLRDSNLWIGAASIIFVAGLVFASKARKNQHVLFGLLWFLIFLAPAFVHSFTFPEYRLYIPIIGVFLIIREIKIFEVLKQFSSSAVVASVIIMFFLVAWNYADVYRDRLAFWNDAATYSKSAPIAHANLAYAYFAYGEMVQAEEEFRKTLMLDPQAATINYNIGVIHYNRGEYDRARQSLSAELSINPAYKPAEDLLKAMKRISSGSRP